MKYVLVLSVLLSLSVNAKTLTTNLSFEEAGHTIIQQKLIPDGVDLSFDTYADNYLDLAYQIDLNYTTSEFNNLQAGFPVPANPSVGSTIAVTTQTTDEPMVYDVSALWELVETDDGNAVWVVKSSQRHFKQFNQH